MLKNMVALVTGAAGSLGSATSKKLVSEGCRVVMVDLESSKGSELAESLGENVSFCAADVTSETDVKSVVDEIKSNHQRLDIVVNCAGMMMTKVLFNPNTDVALDYSRLSQCINVNVLGTLNVARLVVDCMMKNPLDEDNLRGVIINTSGFAAYDGQLGQAVASASWGAISSLTLPLCRELGTYGIRVMGIAPGMMTSNLTNYMKPRVKRGLELFVAAPKRFGRPEEYADLVLNIVLNKYLNGEVIRLDGGLRMNLA